MFYNAPHAVGAVINSHIFIFHSVEISCGFAHPVMFYIATHRLHKMHKKLIHEIETV